LEKAWAKASGTYDITSGGWMNEALDFLTGAPSASWSNTDATTVNSIGANAWNIVKAGDAANYIMTTDVGGGCGSDSDVNSYHLPCGHAYTLVGASTVVAADGTTHRLLQIRNPWGVDAGYNGTWNDADTTSWTAAAKAQVPGYANNTNDGTFFMEDSDFVKSFESFMITYYTDGWNQSYAEVVNDTNPGTQRSWTFTLARAQDVFVGMNFYDSRMYAANCKASTNGILSVLSSSSYLVNSYVYDWNAFNNFRFQTLAAGTYTINFKPNWNAQDVRDYTIRIYAADKVAITAK